MSSVSLRYIKSDITKQKDYIQNLKIDFNDYLKKNEYCYNKKALKLENNLDHEQYLLDCLIYEDNQRRKWK